MAEQPHPPRHGSPRGPAPALLRANFLDLPTPPIGASRVGGAF